MLFILSDIVFSLIPTSMLKSYPCFPFFFLLTFACCSVLYLFVNCLQFFSRMRYNINKSISIIYSFTKSLQIMPIILCLTTPSPHSFQANNRLTCPVIMPLFSHVQRPIKSLQYNSLDLLPSFKHSPQISFLRIIASLNIEKRNGLLCNSNSIC